MAEYRRIVSYLYQYKNGRRGENVGYVRVQRVQDQVKIVLSLKDRKNIQDMPLRIYFYIHKNDKLHGVFVDNVFLQGGNCEYKKTFLERDLFKNGQTIEQMHGMLVYYNRELSYGTEWDDRKIEVNQFVLERKKDDVKKEENNVGSIKRENTRLERVKESGKQEPSQEQEREEQKQEIQFLGSKKEIADPDAEVQEKIVKLLREKKERIEKKKKIEQPKPFNQTERTEAETDENPTIHMQERDEVERMFLEYPKISNIETEDLNDCVKINPKDIAKMDQVNSWLKNNRLLLYRFDQYHHLLLGKRRNQDGSWQRVVGIPGIFDNKERYLASLFQFYSFIPTENKKYRTGSFGYWVTPIK